MKVAHLSEPAEERVIFRDGLGVREWRDTGGGERVEWFHLDPAFAAVEPPLRDRVSRLTKLQHVRFARVLSFEPGKKGKGPVVVSSHVPGTRLADVLEMAGHGLLAFDPGAGLQVTREVLGALFVLHDSRNVSHGALGPERIVLTASGRVVMVEHVLSAALDRLALPRHQLWRDWRIATPPAAGPVRFDLKTDLAQVGVLALAALLGRPLDESEYPHRLRGLLPLVQDRLAKSPAAPLAAEVVAWLERLLPVDSRRAFATVREAQQAFEGLVSPSAATIGVAPARVKGILAAVAALATPPVTPTSGAVGASVPVVAEIASLPAAAEPEIDIEALLRLEAELEGGSAPDMRGSDAPPSSPAAAAAVLAPESAEAAAPADEITPVGAGVEAEPTLAPMPTTSSLDALAQERADLERQFESLVASVAPPIVEERVRLIPEVPATVEPLVDARVRWSSMPADDDRELDAAEVAIASAENDAPPADGLATLAVQFAPDVPFFIEPIVVAVPEEPVPAAAIEHVPADWWREALPWRAGDGEAPPEVHADASADAVVASTPQVSFEAHAPSADDALRAELASAAMDAAGDGGASLGALIAGASAPIPDTSADALATPIPDSATEMAADAVIEPATTFAPIDEVVPDVVTEAVLDAVAPEALPLPADIADVASDVIALETIAAEDVPSVADTMTTSVAVEAGALLDAAGDLDPTVAERDDTDAVHATTEGLVGVDAVAQNVEPLESHAFAAAESLDAAEAVAPEVPGAGDPHHTSFDPHHASFDVPADEDTSAVGALVEQADDAVAITAAPVEANVIAADDEPREEVDALVVDEAVLSSTTPVFQTGDAPPVSHEQAMIAYEPATEPETAVAAADDRTTSPAEPSVAIVSEWTAPVTWQASQSAVADVAFGDRAVDAATSTVDAPLGSAPDVSDETAPVGMTQVEEPVRLEAPQPLADALADAEPLPEPIDTEPAASSSLFGPFVDLQLADDTGDAVDAVPMPMAPTFTFGDLIPPSVTVEEPPVAEEMPPAERGSWRDTFASADASALGEARPFFAAAPDPVVASDDLAQDSTSPALTPAEPMSVTGDVAAPDIAAPDIATPDVAVADVTASEVQWATVPADDSLERTAAVLASADAPVQGDTPEAEPVVTAPDRPSTSGEPVPEVVIVDEGHDRNAWDQLPSEVPAAPHAQPDEAPEAAPDRATLGESDHAAVTAVAPEASEEDDPDLASEDVSAATPETATNRKKRRRSRRKKGQGAPTPAVVPPIVQATTAPPPAPITLAARSRSAESPDDEPLPSVSPLGTVSAMTSDVPDTSVLAARPKSLLEREVPTWTPPADLGALRPRVAQPAARDFVLPPAEAAPAAASDEWTTDSAPFSANGPLGVALTVADTTAMPPVAPALAARAAAPQAMPAPIEPPRIEEEIRAVGMPDLDEITPRSGRVPLSGMSDPMGSAAGLSRQGTGDARLPMAGAGVPEARGRNWRRLIAASVIFVLFNGAAFAAWWWVQPGAHGTLVVQTAQPGVEVLIDGKVIGKTPFKEEVAPGRHKLTLRQGLQVREMPVEISLGVVTTQAVDWPAADGSATGSLQVSSTPAGAEVFIGGTSRGKAPLLLEGLPAGKQELTLRGDAGTVTVSAEVIPGETTPLEVPIFAGWILVDAPVEMSLMLKGARIGSSMDGQILLSPGRHQLQAVSETLGFRRSIVVTIEPGEVKRVAISVPPGTLQVQDEPGSEVFVDGDSIGTLPATLRIPLGTHDVLVRRPDGSERRQTVTVRNGETVTM